MQAGRPSCVAGGVRRALLAGTTNAPRPCQPRQQQRRPTACSLQCSALSPARGLGVAPRRALAAPRRQAGGAPSLRPAPQQPRGRVVAQLATGIIPLGYDFLTFLTATVMVVPACKYLKLSPVLGFLFAGVMLEQAGMLKDLKDMETLSELGVLFLLYEQGLELSLDRLKALAKYAFGMGSLQVIITTLLFTAVALPAGSGLGTWFLERVCHAPPSLVSIRTVDEAVVIAAALSMSSSAFVLQLMSERGETASRSGSATLGILLFQDIAVVPFLVLLPLIESHGGMEGASADTLLQMLGPTTLTSLAGLGALLVGGRVVLRRIFEMVANARSSEAFVAACLLTVGASSLLTKQMGLSDTLGAFVAGVLLSETTFRTQVEADIRPFRGLLIGLFFLSVGGSINMAVLKDNYDIILWMLAGLVSAKAAVNTMLGPLFGLSKSESIRTGFLLSQGGEFAFVLLSLACQLKLLPEELNQILIITVVFSMALTPALAALGSRLAEIVEAVDSAATSSSDEEDRRPLLAQDVSDAVVILGFGAQGQMVANMLTSPLAGQRTSYLGFDLDPACVDAARGAGFNVRYGDGGRADVLKAAGVKRPSAIVVCYSSADAATKVVESLRGSFSSSVPIYACAQNFKHAAELRAAGADHTCVVSSEAGLNLGSELLSDFGTPELDISLLRRGIHEALEVRTAAVAPPVPQLASDAAAEAAPAAAAQAAHAPASTAAAAEAAAEHHLAGATPAAAAAASNGAAAAAAASSSVSSAGSDSTYGLGMSSMDSVGSSISGVSSSISGGKKKKQPVEVFVLDGRWAYGVKAAQLSRAASVEPGERPCSDCPLVQRVEQLEQLDSAAAGSSGDSLASSSADLVSAAVASGAGQPGSAGVAFNGSDRSTAASAASTPGPDGGSA